MRNKKSKLLAFSVLALCVACLAFGVYALKNATLTVTGTVGFTAHDCLVNVVAYVEGDGVLEDGTTSTSGHESVRRELMFSTVNEEDVTATNEILVGGAEQSAWTKTAGIRDTIYFTDLTEDGKPAPIVMTFELENRSAYDVYAKISSTTIEELTAAGVTVELTQGEKVMQEANDTDTDTAVITATFTLDANAVDPINGLSKQALDSP